MNESIKDSFKMSDRGNFSRGGTLFQEEYGVF